MTVPTEPRTVEIQPASSSALETVAERQISTTDGGAERMISSQTEPR